MTTTWNEPKSLSSAPAGIAPAPAEVKEAAPAAKRNKARIVFPVLVALALSAGGGLYLHGLGVESTDDAQVEGHIVSVAARASGQVAKVLVHDNQLVEEGEVIVELDDRDLSAKLTGARADLAQARAQLESAKAQLALTERSIDASLRQAKGGLAQASSGWASTRAMVDQARADIAAAEARRALADSEKKRAQALRDKDVISQAELDARSSTYDQAEAQLALAKARLSAAEAGSASTAGSVAQAEGRLAQAETGPEQLGAARAAVGVAEARVDQMAALLSIAELNVSYTRVKAPVRGVVSRRSVEPGQMVSPDRPLLALVPPDDVWVVANFKEDQITHMHQGQKVELKVDAYGRRAFAGHVESLAGASGARFALLPPDNASGNFVKVVQRIPVLIRLDGAPEVPLRPGMSAYAAVSTKD